MSLGKQWPLEVEPTSPVLKSLESQSQTLKKRITQHKSQVWDHLKCSRILRTLAALCSLQYRLRIRTTQRGNQRSKLATTRPLRVSITPHPTIRLCNSNSSIARTWKRWEQCKSMWWKSSKNRKRWSTSLWRSCRRSQLRYQISRGNTTVSKQSLWSR